jgi:hypothetical protein
MSGNPIDVLESELVRAAARGRRRRRPPRRTVLLAAAVAIVAAGVPAVATGVLSEVFPETHVRHAPGVAPRERDFLVASGRTARGEPWRLVLTKHGPRQQPRHREPGGPAEPPARKVGCYVFEVGQAASSACAFAYIRDGRGAEGIDGPANSHVSPTDHRPMVQLTLPRADARVAVTLVGGRQFFVEPYRLDRRRARRTGVPFPFGIVIFALRPGEQVRGIEYLDARGRSFGTFFRPRPVPRDAQTLKSPAV